MPELAGSRHADLQRTAAGKRRQTNILHCAAYRLYTRFTGAGSSMRRGIRGRRGVADNACGAAWTWHSLLTASGMETYYQRSAARERSPASHSIRSRVFADLSYNALFASARTAPASPRNIWRLGGGGNVRYSSAILDRGLWAKNLAEWRGYYHSTPSPCCWISNRDGAAVRGGVVSLVYAAWHHRFFFFTTSLQTKEGLIITSLFLLHALHFPFTHFRNSTLFSFLYSVLFPTLSLPFYMTTVHWRVRYLCRGAHRLATAVCTRGRRASRYFYASRKIWRRRGRAARCGSSLVTVVGVVATTCGCMPLCAAPHASRST